MRTPEQIKEFILINHHLTTMQEMADELGVSYDYVTKWCADNNIKAIKTKDRHLEFIKNNTDLTIEECAEILGVSDEYVRRLNKEIGEPLLSNKKKQLRDKPQQKTVTPIVPENKWQFTKQEEDNLMNILADIVKTMTPEEKRRFAEKYIEI